MILCLNTYNIEKIFLFVRCSHFSKYLFVKNGTKELLYKKMYIDMYLVFNVL